MVHGVAWHPAALMAKEVEKLNYFLYCSMAFTAFT
jgi:hypothetical protein